MSHCKQSNHMVHAKKMLLNNLYKPLQNYETKKFLPHLRPLFATLRQTYNALIIRDLYFSMDYHVISTRSFWPF